MQIHIAVRIFDHNQSVYVGTSREDVVAQVAKFCRSIEPEGWDTGEDITAERIAAMCDQEVVDVYFDDAHKESITFHEEGVKIDLTVVLEGGNVQSVISQDVALDGELVKVIEYDTGIAATEDLSRIHQMDGAPVEAYAWETMVSQSDVRAFTDEEEAEYAKELAAKEAVAAEESYANAVAAAGVERG